MIYFIREYAKKLFHIRKKHPGNIPTNPESFAQKAFEEANTLVARATSKNQSMFQETERRIAICNSSGWLSEPFGARHSEL